jgi:protein-disulfide isomerase
VLQGRVAPAVVGLVVGGTIVPGVAVTASGLIVTSWAAVASAGDGSASLAVVRLGGRAARPSARDFADAVPARVVALSEDLDLALVEALPQQSVFYRHLPVARRSPPPGTAVLAAGHDAERGLWAGSVAVLGAAPPVSVPGIGARSRWLRALASGGEGVAPGTPLVDAVGRLVGVAVNPGAGAPLVADAEALWRFLLAAGAPERRFAGVSPMRRPPPVGASLGGRTARAATPPSDRLVLAADSAPTPVGAGIAVANKGALDRQLVSVAGAAATGAPRARAVRAAPDADAASQASAKVAEISFDATVRPARLTVADLERHARPATMRIDLTDAPARGATAAPVTLVQLGDYHAPDTREAEKALRALCEGEHAVRCLWKDADRGDADYRLYARAARAAGEQGKFWPMHDRLLASARPMRAGELRRFARGLGLNEEAFAIAIAGVGGDRVGVAGEGAIDGVLQEDGRQAAALPVLATPSFIVNGKPIDGGSIAGAALRAAIDEELAAHPVHLAPPAASSTPSASQAGAEATAGAPVLAAEPAAIDGVRYDAAQIAKAAASAAARAHRSK